ncbi:hypothetical protein GWK47_027140 [Chionoecetes opilio]|uniref:Uncharacterized protein n=1 Tax=Chionoecetes opilio TaxID=41210 RepID=A0A8J8WCV5_CHIOP|nr:hypothetical protein GWK47_027140 [Chionoecetes opilio]
MSVEEELRVCLSKIRPRTSQVRKEKTSRSVTLKRRSKSRRRGLTSLMVVCDMSRLRDQIVRAESIKSFKRRLNTFKDQCYQMELLWVGSTLSDRARQAVPLSGKVLPAGSPVIAPKMFLKMVVSFEPDSEVKPRAIYPRDRPLRDLYEPQGFCLWDLLLLQSCLVGVPLPKGPPPQEYTLQEILGPC